MSTTLGFLIRTHEKASMLAKLMLERISTTLWQQLRNKECLHLPTHRGKTMAELESSQSEGTFIYPFAQERSNFLEYCLEIRL